jgi:hypothetical protein
MERSGEYRSAEPCAAAANDAAEASSPQRRVNEGRVAVVPDDYEESAMKRARASSRISRLYIHEELPCGRTQNLSAFPK